jgi:hypothetical protein
MPWEHIYALSESISGLEAPSLPQSIQFALLPCQHPQDGLLVEHQAQQGFRGGRPQSGARFCSLIRSANTSRQRCSATQRRRRGIGNRLSLWRQVLS